MGQTQGQELPFDIGDRYTCLSGKSIWEVHAGRRKVSGEPVTVFVFDCTNRSPNDVKKAQSAHLRLKTLRHPNILKYIDGIELPTSIYMVTEEATPLQDYLTTPEGNSNFTIAWGLHQVIKAISFLTKDCSLVHRNVCQSAVFVDSAGEWKLAGVEFIHAFGDTSVPSKGLDALRIYDPPETWKTVAAQRTEKWSTDLWGLGCLIWEVYNGRLTQTSALRNTSKIPKNLIPHYCEMVSANPKSRPNPSNLLSQLREHGGFLSSHFVSIALTIEEVQIMEPAQRNEFFTQLNNNLNSFPKNFAKRKILPQLLNAFEFGGAGSSVLAPLFRLGSLLEDEEYQKKVVPCVVKLFSSTDRATRLNLLKQLEHFIDHLHTSTVNQIFPSIANGFSDTVPAMREQTVKCMVLVAPKLSGTSQSGQLLKHLAKCQMDEVPAIRVNTNICLGKIAGHLDPGTRKKVLSTAFIRALKDPFPPARISSISSMIATHSFFSTSDIATKLLPSLCLMTIDTEKAVRDQTFQAIDIFVKKLQRISEDPQAAEEQEKAEAADSTSWTGWAMNSLTAKLYKSSQPNPTPSVGGVKKEKEEPKGHTHTEKNESSDQKTLDTQVVSDRQEEEDFTGTPSGESNRFPNQQDPQFSEDVEAKSDSDMEGWEDDGWGAFDSSQATEVESKQPPATLSSGAEFFETFQTKKISTGQRKGGDFFDVFEESHLTKTAKEKTPPPLVSPSLFASGRGESGGDDNDGWGNWDEDLTPSKQETKKKPLTSPPSKVKAEKKDSKVTFQVPGALHKSTTKSSNDGWDDFGTSNWGTLEETSKSYPSSGDNGGLSKQDELQKKREERKLKQQAAREKRAAGVALKPSGLGNVKKD